MMSCSSSRGRSSVIARASMDFPVPGSPMRRTWRFCSDAFRITSTAAPCPMTCSTSRSGTRMSAVLRKSSCRTQSSTAVSSCGGSDPSVIYRLPRKDMPFTYGPRSIYPLLELTHFPEGTEDSWRPARVALRDLARHLLLRDERGQLPERLLHVLPGPGRREVVGRLVRAREPPHLLVGDLRAVGEVGLVPEEEQGDRPRDLVDRGDPVGELRQGVLARDIANGEDARGPVEVGLLEELPEALLAHDVPDSEVDADFLVGVPGHADLLLGDFRPERGDILVLELVVDEASDETGLSDRTFADQAHLRLHPEFVGHRRLPQSLSLRRLGILKSVLRRLSGLIPATPRPGACAPWLPARRGSRGPGTRPPR